MLEQAADVVRAARRQVPVRGLAVDELVRAGLLDDTQRRQRMQEVRRGLVAQAELRADLLGGGGARVEHTEHAELVRGEQALRLGESVGDLDKVGRAVGRRD